MTFPKSHSFRHINLVAAIAVAALIAAACGGEEAPTVSQPEQATTSTTTIAPTATSAAVQVEHPCDTPDADIRDGYCYVNEQWFYGTTVGTWIGSAGPPATTTVGEPDDGTSAEDVELGTDTPSDSEPELTPEPVTTPSTTPEPEPVPLDECSEGEHRHSIDGGCHTDHEFLPEAPSDCEDDSGDGECSIGEATYQLTDHNDWLHEDIPTQPEVIVPEAVDEVDEVDEVDGNEEPETATGETYDSSCADMAELDDVWITTSDERQEFDLTQPGWYEWTSCLVSDDDNPDLFLLVEGLTSYAGAEHSVYFPGMGSVCREGVEDISQRRFRLRFPVRNDPYDAAIEVEPCWNPDFDGSRGAWASVYTVRNAAWRTDLPYVAYFRLVRVDDAESDAS